MEATCSFETLVDFKELHGVFFPEEKAIRNLKSFKTLILIF
jgi:hypothetical protein